MSSSRPTNRLDPLVITQESPSKMDSNNNPSASSSRPATPSTPLFQITPEGAQFEAPDRFRALVNPEQDTIALIFQRCRPGDSGSYRCVAAIGGTLMSCSAKIRVEFKESSPAQQPNADQNNNPTAVAQQENAFQDKQQQNGRAGRGVSSELVESIEKRLSIKSSSSSSKSQHVINNKLIAKLIKGLGRARDISAGSQLVLTVTVECPHQLAADLGVKWFLNGTEMRGSVRQRMTRKLLPTSLKELDQITFTLTVDKAGERDAGQYTALVGEGQLDPSQDLRDSIRIKVISPLGTGGLASLSSSLGLGCVTDMFVQHTTMMIVIVALVLQVVYHLLTEATISRSAGCSWDSCWKDGFLMSEFDV